jgi:hypothetical protein
MDDVHAARVVFRSAHLIRTGRFHVVPDDIDHKRRQMFGIAAVTIAAAQLGMLGRADAQSNKTKLAQALIKSGAHTSQAWFSASAIDELKKTPGKQRLQGK